MFHSIGDRMRVVGRTDVGCVRTLNEDNFLIDEQAGILIVADGMGGHDAGEVASAQVIETIRAYLNARMRDPELAQFKLEPTEDTISFANLSDLANLTNPDNEKDQSDDPTLDDIPNPLIAMVIDAVNHANQQVNLANQRKGYPDGMGMGSTVVGLWLPPFGEQPVVFHVGDSRLYLFRRGRLLQITQDHSMYQQWVNFGGAGDPPAQNILLQAMGPSRKVAPDVRFQNVEKGDYLLLCSDGMTGMVPDLLIERILRSATADDLDKTSETLINLARERGGKDNITAILGYIVK